MTSAPTPKPVATSPEIEICSRCKEREVETRELCLVCWTSILVNQIGELTERVTMLEKERRTIGTTEELPAIKNKLRCNEAYGFREGRFLRCGEVAVCKTSDGQLKCATHAHGT